MTRARWWPGRDRHAVRHHGPRGAARVGEPRRVLVIGGGIAGLSAATVLAERGVAVSLRESTPRLGGRVAAWPLGDGRTMSRGFHAFFRQYYNLRALLRRTDPELRRLVAIEDYPLVRPDGVTDRFTGIPRTPPWSVLGFVLRSPTFAVADLARVDLAAALALVSVRYPDSLAANPGESAAAYLDRLRFPAAARDLALEVFARSFFADPREFAAAELIAMFHAYFVGSAEGLLFDVPTEDYDTALWAPLGRYLAGLGVDVATSAPVRSLTVAGPRPQVDGESYDAVVVAADPAAARRLLTGTSWPDPAWSATVAETRNAPPFVVVRQWLGRPVRADRPAFVGTSRFGPLDNVSVLERFEAGAAAWASEHHGSVVELHGYAAPEEVGVNPDRFVAELVTQSRRLYPELADLPEVHREVLVHDDCPLVDTAVPWARRPGVQTPHPQVMLAGDWVRCGYPVALMERAATTGMVAANQLLHGWGVAGEDLWTVPMRGLLGGAVPAARPRGLLGGPQHPVDAS